MYYCTIIYHMVFYFTVSTYIVSDPTNKQTVPKQKKTNKQTFISLSLSLFYSLLLPPILPLIGCPVHNWPYFLIIYTFSPHFNSYKTWLIKDWWYIGNWSMLYWFKFFHFDYYKWLFLQYLLLKVIISNEY